MDENYELAQRGKGAESALRFLEEYIEDQKNALAIQIANCPPELPQLLTLQARLRAIMHFEQAAKLAITQGREAFRALESE